MSRLLKIQQFSVFIFLTLVCNEVYAQAKLTIAGANVNIATGIFISTNDLAVSGTVLTASGATLKVANSITSANAIDVSNGTLVMNGALAQQIPANSLTNNLIKNLTISGSGDVTVAGGLTLTDVLTVSGGSLLSNGNLTLKSVAAQTARVAPITTSAIIPVSGNVIVERYISSKRAFRFLTAPVNTAASIRANWMENTNNPTIYVNNNPVPGYGTHITGLNGGANGFDATITNNPSLFTFDNQTQGWIAATSTAGTLKVGIPYRILVRGSRSTNTNLADPAPSITTLRATGTLTSGTIVLAKPGGGGTTGMPVLSATPGAYNFVGNPYASPIDWLLLEKVNLSGSVYIFDPTLAGTNGRGAYVSYNGSTGVSNIASMVDNNIQSGQAFFIETTGTTPSLTIKEIHKSTQHRVVFRPYNTIPYLSLQLLLPGQEIRGGAADGLSVYFSEEFSQGIKDEDSYKFVNQDENIAILRDGKLLSIEGRKPIVATDTIPIKMWQLSQKNYIFKASIFYFEDRITSYLEDSYLQTTQLLTNNDTTLIPFVINAEPASFATDRFKIVFETYATLPVTLSAVKAYAKNKGIQVEWTAEAEDNMEKYEIERSTDAQHFSVKGTLAATNNAGHSSFYSWFDAYPVTGDNYYRIKAVSKTGEIKYSEVVKAGIMKDNNQGSVLAVAANANSVTIKLNNLEKGKYAVNLLNTSGQIVYTGSLFYQGGSAIEVIKPNNILAAGIYHLQLSSGDKLHNVKLMIR